MQPKFYVKHSTDSNLLNLTELRFYVTLDTKVGHFRDMQNQNVNKQIRNCWQHKTWQYYYHSDKKSIIQIFGKS